MTIRNNDTVDLTAIETKARRLRAEYLAGFFHRRTR